MTEKASILTLCILATACGRRNQFLLRGRLVDGRHLGCGGLRSSSRKNAKSDPRRRVCVMRIRLASSWIPAIGISVRASPARAKASLRQEVFEPIGLG